MDERFEEFLSIQQKLLDVIEIRENRRLFKKILKKTYESEIENLRNAEVVVYPQETKYLDPNKWPVCTSVQFPEIDVKEPLLEYETICTALDNLK